MFISQHAIQLTCDNINPKHPWGIFPATYRTDSESNCKKIARSEGWVFHNNNKHSCPSCTREQAQALRR